MYNIWNVSWLSIPSFTAWDPHWGFLERGLLCLWQTEGCASVFFHGWCYIVFTFVCKIVLQCMSISMIFLFVSYWMIFGSDDRDMSICAPGLWKVVQRFGGCCRRCQSVQDAWCRFFNYILELIDSSWCFSSVYHASIPCQKFQPTALVVGDGTFYRDIGDSFQMIDEVCFSSTKNQEHNRVLGTCLDFFPSFWKLISFPLLLVIAEHCSGGLPLCSPGRASD